MTETGPAGPSTGKVVNAVFKGGGAKGVAYAGAIRAMEERGYTFGSVAGTSAGAITAALLAAGAWIAIREFLDTRVWRPADLARMGAAPLLGLTRRRSIRNREPGFTAVAATLQSICAAQNLHTIAYMAVGKEAQNPERRVVALASDLVGLGFDKVRIFNVGRWKDSVRFRSRRNGVVVDSFGTVAEALFALKLRQAEDEGARCHSLCILATPPLFSDPVSLKVARAVQGTVLDVRSGAAEGADVEAAAHWLRQNDVRIIGIILADVSRSAAHGSSAVVA